MDQAPPPVETTPSVAEDMILPGDNLSTPPAQSRPSQPPGTDYHTPKESDCKTFTEDTNNSLLGPAMQPPSPVANTEATSMDTSETGDGNSLLADETSYFVDTMGYLQILEKKKHK
eukprot:scaffold402007_cov55-Attheya_sp.AAC.2